MKAVILAGGIGSRLSEETTLRPKPMVEVGGKPILWHIMKTYAAYGIQDFVICLGYKGYAIKEYFANYVLHMSAVTIDLERNKVELHDSCAENWRVTLVDTGEETMTGEGIKHIRSHVSGYCLMERDPMSHAARVARETWFRAMRERNSHSSVAL